MAAITIGVRLTSQTADLFRILHDLCESCMWAYTLRGAVIACDRPASINRDERGRLHNDTGPAMEFRDGWKIYAVHGVRVPTWIIEHPTDITPAKIEAESNTEIQRVMIERFGWDRYVAAAQFEVRHLHQHAERFHHEDAADDDQDELLLDQDRDHRDGASKSQAARVAHEHLRGVAVEP